MTVLHDRSFETRERRTEDGLEELDLLVRHVALEEAQALEVVLRGVLVPVDDLLDLRVELAGLLAAHLLRLDADLLRDEARGEHVRAARVRLGPRRVLRRRRLALTRGERAHAAVELLREHAVDAVQEVLPGGVRLGLAGLGAVDGAELVALDGDGRVLFYGIEAVRTARSLEVGI